MPAEKELYERIRRIQEGGAQKYHEANEKKENYLSETD